ncbi:TPA: hypothetical protein NNQ18_004583 [Salmonella enterica]|nr:hypothetical protein [Salmonella enterica]
MIENEVYLTIKNPKTGKWVLCNPAVFDGDYCSGSWHSLYSDEEVLEIENYLNSKEQDDNSTEHETCDCVFDIERLVELTKEPSYKMPSGMTREERRAWARSILEGDDENSN